LEYVRSYTTASTSTIDPQPGRFNSPYSIYNHSNEHVVITDTKNHRILIYDNDYNLKKKIPIYGPMEAVGNYSTGYVLTSDNQIAYYYPGESGADHISYAEFDNLKFNNPKSLTLNKSGKAYFIDAGNDRVISASTTGEQTVFEKFNIPTPLALSIATGGDVVYAIYSNKIVAYDSNATELFVFDLTETLSKNLENVYDVDTDVNGNIFILTNSNLIILDRSWQGYNFRSQTTLTIDGVDAYCSSITVNSQGMVHLTGNKLSTENEHGHCIYELNNAGANVYNPDDYVIPDYTTKECLSEPAKYIKVAQDNVYVFDYKNNFESARTITKDTILLLLDNEPHDGLYFVYYDNKPGFLPEVYATVYQANLNKYQALALYDSPVYKYPVKSEDFKLDTLPKDTKFDVVSDAFGFSSIHENKTIYWYQIELNGQIYYIERAAVGETEIEVNKDYGKAKLRASAINTTIKLYNRPKQDNAYVIEEFKDGTEVQLLEEFPTEKEFIHVYVEGVGDGYVLTSEIDTGGMTPGQIVLLVLIVIGGTASVVTLVISRKMYRKR
ncbi:MAG: hypothetical protein IJF76_05460, partial [Clostridia bacterium]|nr:hypothetical protein [Clostridia bacterium]